jgi:hypothetical protein
MSDVKPKKAHVTKRAAKATNKTTDTKKADSKHKGTLLSNFSNLAIFEFIPPKIL